MAYKKKLYNKNSKIIKDSVDCIELLNDIILQISCAEILGVEIKFPTSIMKNQLKEIKSELERIHQSLCN